MTVLDKWEYGNPETVAMRRQEIAQREAKACGDCIYAVSVEFRGNTGHFCENRHKTYGKGCELFKIKKAI